MIAAEVIDLLEFDHIRKYISRYTSTYNGKLIAENLVPLSNLTEINHKGKLVTEAKNILIEKGQPPITFVNNLADSLNLSRVSRALLKRDDIFGIFELSKVSRKTYNFLEKLEYENLEIKKFQSKLFNDRDFENKIQKVFTESGEISDNASTELRKIRNEIVSKGNDLRKVIGKILKRMSEKYLVQEEYATQRDGRIVLPVKVEHKRHVRGFIHSESATGKTVYIEPEETLELNNEILSLTFAEKREIENILRQLTEMIGEKSFELKSSLNAISELDFIFACAQYSQEIIGYFPTILNDKPLEIINGYHPILLKKYGIKNTVALNLKINKNRIIVITGPNAGGKTVVLKTLGLIYLMVLSGIHAPIGADSNLNWVDKILADIGDLQSLEDDLSTFSSHLSNINNILNTADENTLVLLDEIGTGTDPSEGAALATQALMELKNKKAITLATTHHGNLKIIANETEGMQNASMEFDSEKLKPTYKFIQGLPGASYAFEVAARIGFTDEYLLLSRNYLDTKNSKIEELLIELQKKSNSLQYKLNKSEIENTRLSGLTSLYQKKIEKLENQKKAILEKTADEAEEYLSNVNRQVENTIKNIRESNAKRETILAEKKKLDKIKIKNKKIFQNAKPKTVVKEFKPEIGKFAKVINTQTSGEIIELNTAKNKAVLKVGTIKVQVKISQLEYSEKTSREKSNINNKIIYTQNLNSTILDIRGRKPDEAEYDVVKFIDEAYSSNVERVEILHGKGTGALKKMVHDIIKQHDLIKNHYFAKVEFGGEGITIIELK